MSYEFADRLIEMRRAKGLSQEELARELGLSRQAVSKWERAESAPDIGNLVALANIYDVSLDQLVRGVEAAIEPDEADAADAASAPSAQADAEAADAIDAEASTMTADAAVSSDPAGPAANEASDPDNAAAAPASASAAGAPPAPPAPPVPGTAQTPAPQAPKPKKKRTWLKVTLIVMLCLLLLGSIAGCGIGCAISANHAAGIADRLASHHDQLIERGNGSVAASDVRSIEVNWAAGGATVQVVPDSEADGMVVLEETATGRLADSQRMRWAVIDQKLVVASGYDRIGFGLWGCSPTMLQSHLTLCLPESVARNLETASILAASGTYQLDDISCEELSIDLASGHLEGQGLRAGKLDIDMASGNVDLSGTFEQAVTANVASGQATIACTGSCPQRADIDMVSGIATLLLPPDAGFVTQVDRLSGLFTCDFGDSKPSGHNATCLHGDGSSLINVSLTSGQVTVRPL